MYDVTPQVRAHWHALLRIAADAAAAPLDFIAHAAPAPLADLWTRDDLALAFICGFPLATSYPRVRPLVAPVTTLAGGDSPSYRSVWLVRSDSAFDTLASTFGHRIGWLGEHSHSGFNAPRHALLALRSAVRPHLYRESIGPLGHPRAALSSLAAARIDVTALDAYWWWLLQRFDPATAVAFRAIGETPAAPMPPLVCAAGFPEASAHRLVALLAASHGDANARPHLVALGIRRLAPVTRADYAGLAQMDRAACAAGYPRPA
jgi:ABC-type phosphate/phosphonate transport system substrate-binding protein